MTEDHAADEGETPAPEGYERVPIDDWDRVEDALRRLAGPDAVDASDAEISVTSGSAHVAVSRDGAVDAGMPLHAFAKEGVDALYVDAKRGRIRVYGPERVAYEFRNPS